MVAAFIYVKNARVHNLQGIDVRLPVGKFTVLTGLSGSGKSSLAFDTIYAEGHRRYVESLSSYARQFLGLLEKPDVEAIDGLSPAISIEQKTTLHNPRSTVGTVTEIHDYLRLLFARVGVPHCPRHHRPLVGQRPDQIVEALLARGPRRLELLAPVVDDRKGEHAELLSELASQGFARVRVDGVTYYIDDVPALAPRSRHTIEVVVDRIRPRSEDRQRLLESVATVLEIASGRLRIHDLDNASCDETSARQACAACGYAPPIMEPKLFSFNSATGACPSCNGLGVRTTFDPKRVVAHPELSLSEGAIPGWGRSNYFYFRMLARLASRLKFKTVVPFAQLDAAAKKAILFGSSAARGRGFEGVINNIERRWRATDSEYVREELGKLLAPRPCSLCAGRRLRPEACAVLVGERNLPQLAELSLTEAKQFFSELELAPEQRQIAVRILREISDRLRFLVDVGLGYLSLSRAAATLSGGEAQRIRLASQIGSGLTGVTYVLDEPSIGLHASDNAKLLESLRRLRDLGNTVIVVEHDEMAIRQADNIVDMGPRAGRHGGFVVAEGTVEEVCATPASLTGDYLAGRRCIAVPAKRKEPQPSAWLRLRGARGNNLCSVKANFPIGLMVCVTGVSGSGKSTLVNDTLGRLLMANCHWETKEALAYDDFAGYDFVDKVVNIDQSPIGRTPRSNPATYTGLFAPVREVFANLPLARERGYRPGHFSFNVDGGRCDACTGDGVRRVEMHFLPDVFVTCDTCRGRRFKAETLEVRLHGKSIYDVLDMTVEEAAEFFVNFPSIVRRLATLERVGLGYVKLGQNAVTLSGGEAQRVKLAQELAKVATGKTLYLLDEPTTGLHFHDVAMLLEVLLELRTSNNTVVVVEHNLEVIKTADWIIDLGPGGGDEGGAIVAAGPPEVIAACEASLTGQQLRSILGAASAPRRRRRA